MQRGVVELEEGGGGQLGQQRFEDGRVRGDDGLKQAEGALLALFLVAVAGAG